MDVLRVEEEDGHSWELCGLTSALNRGMSKFLEKKQRWMRIMETYYAPVRCTSKLWEIWSRIKAFYGAKSRRDHRRNSAGVHTTISSASARDTGLAMWSPYRTPTFWVGVKRDAYLGR